jgi:2-keto-4-pentenoate hydratase/2-oxohepta-3-ene-1,7-dioic acid hydratase in catechol pathway
MKLCQYTKDGKRAIGLVDADGKNVIDFAAAWDKLKSGAPDALKQYVVPTELQALVDAGSEASAAARYVNDHLNDAEIASLSVPVDDVDLRAPLARPQKFFAIAVNQDSRRRAITPDNPHPTYFVKLNTTIIGPHDTVEVPDIGQCGPEIELVAVIGKAGKRIPVEKAMEHVYGYMVHNDITAHEMRKSTEWVHIRRPDGTEEHLTYPGRYKNIDGFSPMGPWLTTADEVSDPHNLYMASYLNGETVQEGNTSGYYYDLPELISHLSWVHSLVPGDIISCGTCAPKAPWKSSTIDLGKIGGVLESEVGNLGRLRNPLKFVEGKQNFRSKRNEEIASSK